MPADATTDRTAASSTTQGPGSFAWMSSVMPTDAELTEALGYTVTTDGPPSVRPGRKFRNTFIGSGEVAERDCIGVVSPLEQEAYAGAPVTAVSFATEAAATYSAAAFDSVDGAKATFERFAQQWQACDGRTVVRSFAGKPVQDRISDVQITDAVISAVVTLDGPEGVPVVVGRALGVAHDCMVDVDVGFVDPVDQMHAAERAVRLVEKMLSRVATS